LKSSLSGIFEAIAGWPVWVAALWWGSLTTLAFGVVPLLFTHLPSKSLAGNTAATLFGVQALVSVVLGAMLLLASSMRRDSDYKARAESARGVVLAGMLLALLVEFAIAPRIVARHNLALWHAVGSLMLLAQWLCAGVSFWILVKPRSASQSQV
jgi:hypothetical protein